MRLGVFLPNWVGDVVMATPALRALRTLVGDGDAGRRHAAVRGRGARRGARGSTRRLCTHKGQGDAVRCDLRAAKLDAVVLLTNSLRTAGWRIAAGRRERIGMAGNLRSPLLTTRVYPPRRGWRRGDLPTVAGYLQVAQAAGAPPVAPTLELATTAADERLADGVWRRLGWRRDARVAVFNTGGAFGAAKDWPGEQFAALARRLAVERDWRVLVNCGPKERDAARAIVAAAGDDARGEPGRRAGAADRADQGGHSPRRAAGDDRQRAAVLRRGVRRADGDAVRADERGN